MMAFVGSTTVTIFGTVLVPVPKITDLSGNGFTVSRYTHMQITNTVAAGQLNVNTDVSPSTVIAFGLNSVVMPIPATATTVTIGAGGGGAGGLTFGRHY